MRLPPRSAVTHRRPGPGPMLQHLPGQLSLFPDTVAGAGDAAATPGLDLMDEQERQEDAWRERQGLLRTAQLRLAAQRLWGFPNAVRNPDGPWEDLRGRAYDLHASRGCWPAYYLLRAGTDDIQRITVHVRPGCGGIPAVARAAAVLAEVAPVSVVPCDAPYPRCGRSYTMAVPATTAGPGSTAARASTVRVPATTAGAASMAARASTGRDPASTGAGRATMAGGATTADGRDASPRDRAASLQKRRTQDHASGAADQDGADGSRERALSEQPHREGQHQPVGDEQA